MRPLLAQRYARRDALRNLLWDHIRDAGPSTFAALCKVADEHPDSFPPREVRNALRQGASRGWNWFTFDRVSRLWRIV